MAQHDTIKAERRRADLRSTVLAVHDRLGGDLTARVLAAELGLSYNTAKRFLQAYRASGDLPAYRAPRRGRQLPDPARKNEWNRQYRLRLSARRAGEAEAAARKAATSEAAREREAARAAWMAEQTAKIQAKWSAAQRAHREVAPPPEWRVPGSAGGAVTAWNGLRMGRVEH